MEYFKLGISDWEIRFKDGDILLFDKVRRETIVTNCEGEIFIKLELANLNTDIISILQKDIVGIQQTFLAGVVGEESRTLTISYMYDFKMITNVDYIKIGEIGSSFITFKAENLFGR